MDIFVHRLTQKAFSSNVVSAIHRNSHEPLVTAIGVDLAEKEPHEIRSSHLRTNYLDPPIPKDKMGFDRTCNG